MRTLIKNANLITPYEIVENGSLEIRNGVIYGILRKEPDNIEYYEEIIDAHGKFLSPGFIDIHNHGNFGHDAMEGTREALESIADFHIRNGVTSFLATIMTEDPVKIERAIENARDYIDNQNTDFRIRSQALGIYLEGPYFSMEKKGAQPAEYIKNPNLEEVKRYINLSKNNIRVVALAPEIEGSSKVIKYLKNNGITISCAHTNGTFEEIKRAIDLGVTQATHLYNGMRAFNHREPGVIGAVLTDERVLCEIIADGIHLHPAAIDLAVKTKGKDGIILISDAMMATGLEDGKYSLGGQDVYVKYGEARLESGSLAGSTLTLSRAVYNMVHLVNVKLEDAVRMASLNPAKSIGVDERKGSIELGKDADLIIFDKYLNVEKAFVRGQCLSIDNESY